jgi:mannose-1-phosphate guanylyltransferase/phosphomannomutase
VTPEFAAKLGVAYGALLGPGSSVSTSRDAHPASRMVNRALICGLLSAGVNVDDLRSTPIPILRYQLKSGREQGGIHTRKSPFDPNLVDIIFFDHDGKDLPPGKVKSLERLFLREDIRRADPDSTGTLEFPARTVESYREGLLSHVDTGAIRSAGFKIVIDYACGAGATIFPAILGELGIEVVALGAFLKADRLTKTSEDFEASQRKLSEAVRSLGADVGFLLDSGAERVYLADETGRVLDGDQATALASLLAMRSGRYKKIAVPVTASRAIEEMGKKHGVEVVRSRIDNRSLMETAASEGVGFVISRKGGFIFPEFQPAFDAMLAVVKILELMAVTKARLGGLAAEVPPSFLVRRNFPCPFSKKGQVLRCLIERTKDLPDREMIDGLKLSFGRDWVQVIPDPNREMFHVNAEAGTAEKAEQLIGEYWKKMETCLS